jgi:hypothetical protein
MTGPPLQLVSIISRLRCMSLTAVVAAVSAANSVFTTALRENVAGSRLRLPHEAIDELNAIAR